MKNLIIYIFIYIISISGITAQITSEEILIKNDSIALPGTLTYSAKNQPLLIWVHGSGNVDRNGNQTPTIKANYIKQFRDSINKNNIAFFSYDKRTATKSNIKLMLKNGANFKDFATDVDKVIAHFKNDKRFTEVILVGHSQGSLVAMLVSENFDKYISLAGPSLSADQMIIKQLQEKAPFLDSITKSHFKELKETGKIKQVNPMLKSVFAPQNQSFLQSWMQFNPSEDIKKIAIPILIINGDKDLQVKEEEAKALHLANPKSELVIIKNMNHIIKNIEKDADNMSSYFSPDYPISKELITTITNFIHK